MQQVAIYLAAGASIATVCGVIYNIVKTNEVHVLVNSRLTQLLELTHSAAKAEGIKEEKEQAGL